MSFSSQEQELYRRQNSSSVQDQVSSLLNSDNEAIGKLITASHILAHYKILDGFGHITIRSPTDPSLFYFSSTPAALISSGQNYTVFRVADGTPLDPNSRVSPYSEHYIHAGLYAAYPEITSTVHSHARETIPFGLLSNQSDQNLRAVIHTCGFLGHKVPVWDAAAVYPQLEADGSIPQPYPHNLLVNSFPLGKSLAAAAAASDGTANLTEGFNGTMNHHKVVLQRGHGFSATGTSVEEAVFNSYYTVENAIVLNTALSGTSVGNGGDVTALSEDEIQACTVMDFDSIQKVWPLWVAEVERSNFYRKE